MNAIIYRWTKDHQLQTAQPNHMDQSIDWITAAIVPNENERFRMSCQGVLSGLPYIAITDWNGLYKNGSFKSGLLNFKLFGYGSRGDNDINYMLTVEYKPMKHWLKVHDGSLYDIIDYIQNDL